MKNVPTIVIISKCRKVTGDEQYQKEFQAGYNFIMSLAKKYNSINHKQIITEDVEKMNQLNVHTAEDQ